MSMSISPHILKIDKQYKYLQNNDDLTTYMGIDAFVKLKPLRSAAGIIPMSGRLNLSK